MFIFFFNRVFHIHFIRIFAPPFNHKDYRENKKPI